MTVGQNMPFIDVNRKLARVTVLFLLTFMLGACKAEKEKGFALYVVSGISDPRQVDKTKLADIPLEEDPLIAESDIISYDPETHQMELAEEAYARVNALFSLPVDVDGMPFVVVVGDEPIYSGAFYTPLSSISYSGVVIMQPLGEKARTLSFGLGYPGLDFFEGSDPRSDFRIINRLRVAGKVK
jgi:hypothetical protein